MSDMARELTMEYRRSTECKDVLDFMAQTDRVIDSKMMDDMSVEVPFSRAAFIRVCNTMITLHRETMVRENGGVTVTGDGVKVSTHRIEGGMGYSLQRDALAPAV